MPDYEDMSINIIRSEDGAYPPPEQEMLIERASLVDSLGLGDVEIGDTLLVETPSGKQREIRVAGTVHDMTQIPAFMNGAGYGYVTFDTLGWLGEPEDFNQLVFTVADNELDYEHVNDVGKAIQNRMEAAVSMCYSHSFHRPGEHPAQNFLDGFSLILGAIGLLSLILSGFIIINTLSAIMTQQVRQIGIMKSIGAKSGQVAWLYVVMVLAFGLLSLLIAIPLGMLGGIGVSSLFAGLLNFDVGGLQIFPQVILVQTLIALIAPLLGRSGSDRSRRARYGARGNL